MASDTTSNNPEQDSKASGATAGGTGTKPGTSGAAGKRAASEELEVQVARLREDVSNVADAMKALAAQQADGARRQAYALRDDVRDRGERYVRQAQDAASEIEAQVSERVRAEPIKSVLIAAGIGYLYARLFR